MTGSASMTLAFASTILTMLALHWHCPVLHHYTVQEYKVQLSRPDISISTVEIFWHKSYSYIALSPEHHWI